MENLQNNTATPQNVTEYPDCFFTNSQKNENINNRATYNDNRKNLNMTNLFGDGIINNLLPLFLGKNKSLSNIFGNSGINISNILNSKQDISSILSNKNFDITKIFSLFSNNKGKSNKSNNKQDNDKNIIDLSEYTEVL